MYTLRPGAGGPVPLPAPDAAARNHGRLVEERIRRDIEAGGGRVTFARFMELALYAPGLGYYSAGLHKFGRDGDYITAPELSPLFSRCVARQCAQVLGEGAADVLEFGAGSGVMARDVLYELEALQRMPRRYFILEVSADLRRRQRDTLAHAAPRFLERVQWLERLPEEGFAGVMLANEVLDAFPVHRFYIDERGRAGEQYVGWEDGRFVWRRGPLSSSRLEERLQHVDEAVGLAALGAGYTSEIGLAATGWAAAAARCLKRGLVLIIDYGYPRAEYYHPQRRDGTLTCHYRHHHHADPLILAGLQDITTHVEFTAVAESAAAGGLTVAGYTNQANFLLAAGIAGMGGAESGDAAVQYETAQQIKRLTVPQEMGEIFKVMALTRGLDTPLLGFALRDYRGRL